MQTGENTSNKRGWKEQRRGLNAPSFFDTLYESAGRQDSGQQQFCLREGRLVSERMNSAVNMNPVLKNRIRAVLGAAFLGMILCTGCGPVSRYTEADGPVRVALVVDMGGIDDKGFNQKTFEACKEFCEANSLPFTYFIPDKAIRYSYRNVFDAAVASGFNVLVACGNQYAQTLAEMSLKYPEVKFIGIDMDSSNVLSQTLGNKYDGDPSHYEIGRYLRAENTYLMTYREDIAGYLAGYAAVYMGYESLGYIGGIEIPAVMRYGYGFLQGIRDAAEELGNTDRILVRYAYAGQFTPAAEITAAMETWYQNGTQVVFSCGGGIYSSVAEAGAKSRAKIIGVDLDQKEQLDAYLDGMTVTSALKKLDASVQFALQTIVDGDWEKKAGGRQEKLGIVTAEDPELNYVGLPEETTQWNERFGVKEYRELLRHILDGSLTVDPSTDSFPELPFRVERRQGTIM